MIESARSLACVLLLTVLVVDQGTGSQNPKPPGFRISNEVVPIYATVSHGGRLIPDLTRDDFIVLDNGRQVSISVFDNTPQPITVVILLDLSGSMWPRLALMRNAAIAFVSMFGERDKARIGGFSSVQIGISARWTNRAADLEQVLKEELWPGPLSPVWNAIDVAITAMAEETGRKVLLALTDGRNNASIPGRSITRADVTKRAIDEGLMVYIIGPPGSKLSEQVAQLAEATGGGHFELAEGEDIAATARQVSSELHHQYLLGFTPLERDGLVHNVEVQARDSRLRVRARRQYKADQR